MHVQTQVEGVDAPRTAMSWRHSRAVDMLVCEFFLCPSDIGSLGSGVRMDYAEEIHLASGSLWRL